MLPWMRLWSPAFRVFVLYRRGKPEMPGWESEYLEACALGVEFRWLSGVNEILALAGRVSAVRVGHLRYSGETLGGRRWVEPDPGQPDSLLACDSVILAPGQKAELHTALAFGAAERNGLVATHPGTFQTSNPRVFAAGEAVLGGATIVASLRSGMLAAAEIHAFLHQEGFRNG
jgi:dihydropyrimidine dehydrogenase (NAD+) subunit PreT